VYHTGKICVSDKETAPRVLEHPEARTNGGGPLIEGSVARDPYPDPEGQGGDLEHIGEISVRALLPTTTTKLRSCAGCSGRFVGRDLFDVGQGNLTFFEEQRLCRECAQAHGVI
jgi:hypothetical protein